VHLKKLGRYELVRVLGKGAMGVVYEGRDPNLDRSVALKTIMVDDLSPDAAAEYETRFRTEARSAARLQHPNIVSVYDSDRDGGTAFLVMEYVQGRDLKQRLDGGERPSLGEALRLLGDLLSALDFAHRQGIVHRDVKPANLLVEADGRLKLTDFGVARIAGEATRTQGSMIGTLKYMAPEQIQGLKVDARADLFSAGVVAYQLLTGVRPFDGDNDFSVIHQVIGHTPPPPSTVAPQLPPAVDPVLARALEKDREARFQSAAEFLQALREAFAGLDEGALAALRPPAPVPASSASADAPTVPMTRPATTVPNGPITHELELEYWRDVRDSSDPRDIEGFLARFPQGIYADLARGRLQRLSGAGGSPEPTVPTGITLAPARAPAEAGAGLDTVPTLPLDPTAPQPAPAGGAAVSAAPAGEVAVSTQPPVASGAVPADRARLPRRNLLWIGAAAAVAGFALAVALMGGRAGGPGEAEAMTPMSPPAVDAAVPAADPLGQAAAPAHAGGDAAAPAAHAEPNSAAAKRPSSGSASTARRNSVPVAMPTVAPAATRAEPAKSEKPEKSESAVAAVQATRSQAQRLVPPAETCGDKFFLAKQFCLQAECAKPGYQNFPACVTLREQARLREESKVRN